MTDIPFKPADTSLIAQNALAGGGLEKKKMGPEQAAKAGEDFEAMFLAQMMSAMWAGLETDGIFGGGSAEETYRGMLINEYGSNIARTGGLGIADAVRSELLKLQEKP